MADRRMLAQQITHSSQVAVLIRRHGPWAGLFYTWCLPFVDDDSRLIGIPDQLRHKVLGRYLDQVSDEDVAAYLATMNELDLVVWYEVRDVPEERYLYFPKFSLHQTLRTDRYGPSRHPAPPTWQPEEGHPYTKNPELQKGKPQRDRRPTRRVARKAVNKGEEAGSATAGEPPADRSALSGDEASLFLAVPRSAIPRPSAAAAASAAGSVGTFASQADGARESDVARQMRELLEGVTDARWRDALQRLLLLDDPKTTSANVCTWFRGTTLEEQDGFMVVRGPNGFAVEWLATKGYRPLIAKVLGVPPTRVVIALAGQKVELEPEPVEEES